MRKLMTKTTFIIKRLHSFRPRKLLHWFFFSFLFRYYSLYNWPLTHKALTQNGGGHKLEDLWRRFTVWVHRFYSVLCKYDGHNRTWCRQQDQERSPGEQIGGKRPECFHQVGILSARFRNTCSELNVTQPTSDCNESCTKPHDQSETNGLCLAQNSGWGNKNPRPNNI